MRRQRIHIVGAGIAGISAGYFLSKKGFLVSIYEKESKLGGLIGTYKTPYGLVESGAHAFLNSPLIEELSSELGVDFLNCLPLAKKNRFIEDSKGKPSRWPLGLMATLRAVIGILLFKFLKPRTMESVYSWSKRLFGTVFTERILTKVLQGIYAASPENLSAKLVFGRFYQAQPRAKAKVLFKGSVAPKEGMQSLLEEMKRAILEQGGSYIQKNITSFEFESWLASGEKVVLATPIWIAAEFLSSVDPDTAKTFSEVPSVALEATTLFWSEEQIKPLRPGFGVLLDREVGSSSLLGVLENNQIFESRVYGKGTFSETWISSGFHEVPLKKIKAKRARLQGLARASDAEPLDVFSFIWKKAIPVVGPKLEYALSKDPGQKLEARGIYLVGNYMGPIGVSKILERSLELSNKVSRTLN